MISTKAIFWHMGSVNNVSRLEKADEESIKRYEKELTDTRCELGVETGKLSALNIELSLLEKHKSETERSIANAREKVTDLVEDLNDLVTKKVDIHGEVYDFINATTEDVETMDPHTELIHDERVGNENNASHYQMKSAMKSWIGSSGGHFERNPENWHEVGLFDTITNKFYDKDELEWMHDGPIPYIPREEPAQPDPADLIEDDIANANRPAYIVDLWNKKDDIDEIVSVATELEGAEAAEKTRQAYVFNVTIQDFEKNDWLFGENSNDRGMALWRALFVDDNVRNLLERIRNWRETSESEYATEHSDDDFWVPHEDVVESESESRMSDQSQEEEEFNENIPQDPVPVNSDEFLRQVEAAIDEDMRGDDDIVESGSTSRLADHRQTEQEFNNQRLYTAMYDRDWTLAASIARESGPSDRPLIRRILTLAETQAIADMDDDGVRHSYDEQWEALRDYAITLRTPAEEQEVESSDDEVEGPPVLDASTEEEEVESSDDEIEGPPVLDTTTDEEAFDSDETDEAIARLIFGIDDEI